MLPGTLVPSGEQKQSGSWHWERSQSGALLGSCIRGDDVESRFAQETASPSYVQPNHPMRREFLSPGPQCKHSRRNRRHNQAFRRRKVPLQCIHLVKKSHKIVFTIKYLKVTKLFVVEIFLRLTVSTLQLAVWADRLVSLEVGKSSLGL